MTCQDDCGIRTVPDPFFSLPNDKEKKVVWPSETSSETIGRGVATTKFRLAHFSEVWLQYEVQNILRKYSTSVQKIISGYNIQY